MKIAIVYHFFAHYRGPIIERLKQDKDIDYYFLAGTKTNSPYSSLKLYDFKMNENFIELNNIWINKYFLWQVNLTSILKKENFDGVIFLGDWKFLSTWKAINYLENTRTMCFFWGHGLLTEKSTFNNIIKFHFLKRFKNGGFLYSHRAKNIMLKKQYSKDLEIIYNSLNYEKQQEVVRKIDHQLTLYIQEIPSPYVIFTGRLIPQRKLEQLFDAVEILKNKNINLCILIIGDGPHKEKLKLYADLKNLSKNVYFIGSCYDESKLGYYFMNSIACVYPGPIGLTIIHAMTYGVPVITNDNIEQQKPEIEALIPGVNGFFFKNDDISSLADQIMKIIKLSSFEKNSFKINAMNIIKEKYNPYMQAKILKNKLLSNSY